MSWIRVLCGPHGTESIKLARNETLTAHFECNALCRIHGPPMVQVDEDDDESSSSDWDSDPPEPVAAAKQPSAPPQGVPRMIDVFKGKCGRCGEDVRASHVRVKGVCRTNAEVGFWSKCCAALSSRALRLSVG